MAWRRLGHVFVPKEQQPWMRSHAANPVAEALGDGWYKIYVSCRDAGNRSSVGFVVVDIAKPTAVVDLSPAPVLSPGPPGAFDDSGISIACIVRVDERRYLYYMGWNLAVTVPWRNSIGLAVSEAPGAEFKKVSRAAIMDRDDADPFSLSYPWVERDGAEWRMWYGSNLAWGKEQDSMQHVIKYATSTDGVAWRRSGVPALALQPAEVGLSRPCVERTADGYAMWYCARGTSASGGHYRIGYAESKDGTTWQRLDQNAGIAVGTDAWETNSLCYPFVFTHGSDRYLLYCGNGYGRSGFGIARWEGR